MRIIIFGATYMVLLSEISSAVSLHANNNAATYNYSSQNYDKLHLQSEDLA